MLYLLPGGDMGGTCRLRSQKGQQRRQSGACLLAAALRISEKGTNTGSSGRQGSRRAGAALSATPDCVSCACTCLPLKENAAEPFEESPVSRSGQAKSCCRKRR